MKDSHIVQYAHGVLVQSTDNSVVLAEPQPTYNPAPEDLPTNPFEGVPLDQHEDVIEDFRVANNTSPIADRAAADVKLQEEADGARNEEQRLADEEAAEAKRVADEKAAKEIEDKRLADEKEAKRLADEKKLAEDKALADKKAADEAAAKKLADDEAAAKKNK